MNQRVSFCPACGAALAGARFCPHCGAPAHHPGAAYSAPSPPPPPPLPDLRRRLPDPPGRTYEVDAHGARLKVRNPVVVTILSVVTLGIYSCVWWYKINREMRDFGRVYRQPELAAVNPVWSVLAITVGAVLVVPPFISLYNTVRRVQTVNRIVGVDELSGWAIAGITLVSILFIFWLIAFASVYVMQEALNRAYRLYPPRAA